ncbi:MAG: VWA domain-containing protein [Verrucomicrobiota bacterium]|nr:VWA domain-containing protein [Verrucomicrobiota bacterium]
MVVIAELTAFFVLALTSVTEMLHWQRSRRIAVLAFGPTGRPLWWVHLTPYMRILALTALSWGLVTLLQSDPKVFRPEEVSEGEMRNVILLLDVSPSMKLQDAGPELNLSRSRRAAELMESFFKRVVMESVRLSVVAFYTGAKPVVVNTKDVAVVKNILNDLPLHQAFENGRTQLFDGLRETAKIAKTWRVNSTTVVLISDGDTIPSTGIPKMPPSVSDVLVIGVGDIRSGKFINGYQSRQDASTLRQVAARLKATYHDGNQKHVSSAILDSMTAVVTGNRLERLGRREYALICCVGGGFLLAFIPCLLALSDFRWRPGVQVALKGQVD